MTSQSVQFSYLKKSNKVNKKTIKKPPVNSVSVIELFAFVIIFYLLNIYQVAFSKEVLLGGLIFFIPSTLFNWIAYRFTGAKYSRQVINSFYIAEVLKFSMTVGLFAFVFIRFNTLEAWVLMTAYGLSWFFHQILMFTVVFKRAKN